MHLQNSRLNLGEEVASVEVIQAEGAKRDRESDGDEGAAMGNRPFEQAIVALSETVEAALELLLEAGEETERLLRLGRPGLMGMRRIMLQQDVLRHSRHQRIGQDEGSEYREDHRLRHRHEQPAGHAAQLEKREPNHADCKRRDERRDDDLIGRVDNRRFERLAHLEMGIDVFDHYGGVVDEHTDGQRQTAQCHNIDRLPGPVQRDERSEDGERNRHDDNRRRPPGAEQQQHDEADQRGGDHHLAHDVRDRFLHELRSVVEDFDLYPFGHDLFDTRNRHLDSIDHV